MWATHIHERVRNPTYMGGFKTERGKWDIYSYRAKYEVRHLGDLKGMKGVYSTIGTGVQ